MTVVNVEEVINFSTTSLHCWLSLPASFYLIQPPTGGQPELSTTAPLPSLCVSARNLYLRYLQVARGALLLIC